MVVARVWVVGGSALAMMAKVFGGIIHCSCSQSCCGGFSTADVDFLGYES